MKQDRALQRRSSAILALARLMFGDQELIGSTGSNHFDSHQDWNHDNGMDPVHAQRIDGLQLGKRLALLFRESHVSADLDNGAA